MSTTAVSPSQGSHTTTATSAVQDPLTQKDTFLKLLVAQIRNQNPLNPSDSTQFLTQLAQFSQLEQMVEIRSEIEGIAKAVEPAASAKTAPAGGGN